MPKHIILGAGGAIGNILTEELLTKKETIKLVSRHGQAQPGTESQKADLTNFNNVNNAVEQSSIVYLVPGLEYKLSVWQEQWPKIMTSAIASCKAKNAKLIFFDNVYMYGRVNGSMTEDTPFNPISKKGEVRAKIASQLMGEMKSGNIQALIARSADFYGPYTEKSGLPYILVIQNLAQGKRAQWLANAKTRHSFTYTCDCGKALYMLATNDDAFNQVWHLPTASPPITGEEYIRIAADYLSKKPAYTLLGKLSIRLAGIFNPTIRELYEMLYQNEFDYIFDSSKFEKRFQFSPTPYRTGLKETIEHFRQRKLI